MVNRDSERKPKQTETDRLRDEIAQVRKKIASYQLKIDEHVSYFEKLQIRPFERATTNAARYGEMIYLEKKLGLAQQELTSLILELLSLSSDQLDSDVKTLSSGIEKVSESSRNLELLTYLLIFVALISFAEAVVQSPPSTLFIIIEVVIVLLIVVAGKKTGIMRRRKRTLD